jgi:hypothetical protein
MKAMDSKVPWGRPSEDVIARRRSHKNHVMHKQRYVQKNNSSWLKEGGEGEGSTLERGCSQACVDVGDAYPRYALPFLLLADMLNMGRHQIANGCLSNYEPNENTTTKSSITTQQPNSPPFSLYLNPTPPTLPPPGSRNLTPKSTAPPPKQPTWVT